MSSNPVYLFFSSPPSLGPVFLRLALSAVFFYHGAQKTIGWFGGDGWQATIAAWTDPAGMNVSYVLIAAAIVAEAFVAISLFLGLLTRFSGLAIVVLMAGTLFYTPVDTGFDHLQLPIILLAGGLSLFFSGGGLFSIDRSISANLLPEVG